MYELQIDLYEKTPTTLLKYTLSDATHHNRALYAITYFYLVLYTCTQKCHELYCTATNCIVFSLGWCQQ